MRHPSLRSRGLGVHCGWSAPQREVTVDNAVRVSSMFTGDHYFSPLKVFEYMAAGLPVVAPAVARLPTLIEHAREGILYDPADAGALAATG